MAEGLQRVIIQVVCMESLVGSYPHAIALPKQISDKITVEGLQRRVYRTELKAIAMHVKSLQSKCGRYPYIAVMFDVTDGNVRRITLIGAAADTGHTARLIELIAIDAVACHLPHGSLRVAMHLHRRALQALSNVVTVHRRHHTAHLLQVNNHRPLGIRYPKSLATILGKAQTRPTVALKWGCKGIAVVTNDATTKTRHPDKTLTVHENIVYMVMRQPNPQVETRHIIAFNQHV